MFVRRRAPGLWLAGTVVQPAEFEYFDQSISDAIDGAGGGTYSPSTDLVIGGAPGVKIRFQTQFNAEGDVQIGTASTDVLAILSTSFVSGAFNVTGLSNFQNDVQFQTNAFFYDDVTFNEDVTISATGVLGVYGLSGFHDDATFSKGLAINSAGFLNADCNCFLGGPGFIELLGDTTVRKPVTLASGGYIKRRITLGPDSNLVIGPKDTDEVIVQAGTITAPGHIYTIDDTDAEDDAMMIFTTEESAQEIIIAKPGGALFFRLSLTAGSGKYRWAEVHRVGGSWILGRREDP